MFFFITVFGAVIYCVTFMVDTPFVFFYYSIVLFLRKINVFFNYSIVFFGQMLYNDTRGVSVENIKIR